MPATARTQPWRAVPLGRLFLDRRGREHQSLGCRQVFDETNRLPLRSGPSLDHPRRFRIYVCPAVWHLGEWHRPQLPPCGIPALLAPSCPFLQRFLVHRIIVAQRGTTPPASLKARDHPYRTCTRRAWSRGVGITGCPRVRAQPIRRHGEG